MRRQTLFPLLLLLLCSCAAVPPRTTARPEALGGIQRIAVLPFTDAPNAEAGYSGRVFSSAVIERLVGEREIIVVERGRIDEIIREKRLRATDFVDRKLASEVGRLAGADAVIAGAVSEYKTVDIPVFLGLAMVCSDRYKVGLSLRLINVGNEQIAFSGSHQCGSFGGYEQTCRQALDPILDELTAQLARYRTSPPPARTGKTASRVPRWAPSPVRPQAPSPSVPPSVTRNVHVLVVGIKDYEDETIPRLKYSARDAEAVYEFFRKSNRSPARAENVHFLGDKPNEDGLQANRLGIMQAISRYLIRKATDERDMAILYFSGHGDTGKHPTKNAAYYLIPRDAQRTDLFNTAIELDELQTRWNAIRARSKLLIADACNAGGFSGMKNLNIRGLESVETGGTIVITSAAPNEKSLESDPDKKGLFTQVLLEGLQGKADDLSGDRDGRVSLGELRSWLENTVPKRAARIGGRQTPVVKVPDGWGGVYLTR